jgi:hypothetical protein
MALEGIDLSALNEAILACWLEMDRGNRASWLGYSSVGEMEDHLLWLETRFPEGAEL